MELCNSRKAPVDMSLTGVIPSSVAAPSLVSNRKSKVRSRIPASCSLDCSTSDTSVNEQGISKKFSYSRASPSVRWPHLNFPAPYQDLHPSPFTSESPDQSHVVVDVDTEVNLEGSCSKSKTDSHIIDEEGILSSNEDEMEVLGRPSKTKAKKMTKLALKRAKDWRNRVQFLTDRILELKSDAFVADVLDEKLVQMTPTDFCFLVKWLGKSSWQRALEVYEWLNLRHWYSPNARMLATILAVLGKANQVMLAVEIFTRAGHSVDNTVQVYNAMMGVYARNGRFTKVQELLDLMRERGCEPDLVSFNTLINARLKSGPMTPNLANELLNEVRRSGICPDIITYNTLISACSRESNLEEAVKIFNDMEMHKCQPDLWTYNAIISVFGRCGLPHEAERLFDDLESKGFFPDAVTYNSLLYAFVKDGKAEKVREICNEMVSKGFGMDEMTYNTIIHMHGKLGQLDLALQLYSNMKTSGLRPDAVTYTVLIDSLGKANKVSEAAQVMSEMLNAGVRPTLQTYSALICGYAKAGKRMEAHDMFDCMCRSGIRPDHLAYSVVLDVHLRSGDCKKAMALYQNMVQDGLMPDGSLCEVLLRVLGRENDVESISKVVKDLEQVCNLGPQVISSILAKGECYDFAANMLRSAVANGSPLDKDNLLSILSSYSSSGRHAEAIELLDFIKENAPGCVKFISEALVVVLCKSHNLNAALEEYHALREFGFCSKKDAVYDTLIKCCEEHDKCAEASQIFSDMRFCGMEPSPDICHVMAAAYCRLGFPETGQCLVDQADASGYVSQDMAIYASLIKAYGELKLLEKAEDIVRSLRQRFGILERKAWNALISAYAACGCYEKARAAFNTMMKDGPSPTMDSVNGLLHALVVDGRLDELYLVIQELQDMSFKIGKSSIILMLDAFAQAGNIFEVKKIYNGMKAAGYFPTMHLYRVMIRLLTRGKHVRDAEVMVSEMEEAGFAPDIQIWNSMLKLYVKIEDFKKTIQVYQQIREAGLQPDEETYNALILMYCRDRRPDEGLSLINEMRRLGLEPRVDTYKSLIAAFCKQSMVEEAEKLFEDLNSEGKQLNRSFYHLMMRMYRNLGNNWKAERLLVTMKESGVEPSTATMHLLMMSYGGSGHPKEAENVLNDLKSAGATVDTLQYSSVIDAYLKNGDYDVAIQKLKDIRIEGLAPDHKIWTCFIRAASLCLYTTDAIHLLDAIGDAGFDLPRRLLKDNPETLVAEMDDYLMQLLPLDDNAAFNVVNALEDLLWSFELRAAASWIFRLAIKRNIYHCGVFRVADKDWGADFRKLSAGAALVGLTLWLDHMQDASLEGTPQAPKSVVLITGASEYNKVSLNSTLKAYLWEMGSPFLPCKTRSGLLVAKAHSLRMWLKDSPFCFDLELRNSSHLPEMNSMQLIEGCYIRRGLVPAFKDINEKLGQVTPKKFSRLALLPDEKRGRVIRTSIDRHNQKIAKTGISGVLRKKSAQFRRKRFTRTPIPSK